MRWADDRQLFGGGMFVETPGLAHTRGGRIINGEA